MSKCSKWRLSKKRGLVAEGWFGEHKVHPSKRLKHCFAAYRGMASVCSICFESFNKSSRVATKCPYCALQTCRTCLQTYLLNDVSDIPKCINPTCGHGYSREFLDGELTQTFRLNTYKKTPRKGFVRPRACAISIYTGGRARLYGCESPCDGAP